MNKRLKSASIMLYVVSGVAILFGLVYSFTPKIMSYHERFLGMTHDQLEPKVAELLLFILKGAGAAGISIGLSLAMLVKGPLSKGDAWAWWIILVMALMSLVPLLLITLNMGLYTPWWVVGGMIMLVITALAISKPPK
jgi:hypothetical protein